MKPINDLTAKEVRDIFNYNPDIGLLTWCVYRKGTKGIGKEAGNPQNKGYRQVHINYKRYLVHRIIWLFVTGAWPEEEIDHINGIRDDNRWNNLRQVTAYENKKNSKRYKNNTSGVTGVSWNDKQSKWVAYIHVNNKMNHFGFFANKSDAIAKRKRMEIKYNFHANHGRS